MWRWEALRALRRSGRRRVLYDGGNVDAGGSVGSDSGPSEEEGMAVVMVVLSIVSVERDGRFSGRKR